MAAPELFAVPRRDGSYVLYAPLRRAAAVGNASAARELAELRAGRPCRDGAVQAALEAAGLAGGPEPAWPVRPEVAGFRPHEATLFLTSRCNLRCTYCYADAGRRSIDMPWPVAEAAIREVADNAQAIGLPGFAVGFHGAGEPTVAWGMLTRCVAEAQAQAAARGLAVELFTATNGLLDAEQRAFIATHLASATVSCDGPPAIQDRQRPVLGGGPSSPAVFATLEDFDRRGFSYALRLTVTRASAPEIAATVAWLAARFRPQAFHLEPVWACGRCLTSGEEAPDDAVFAEGFAAAAAAGRAAGRDVIYSGARLDTLSDRFCAAPGDAFTVLPEGVVTTCFEVTDLDDPRAAVFHVGRLDPASGRFAFDAQRLAALRRLSVEHLAHCGDCFCRWHCAGDCLAKALRPGGGHHGSPRCGLNQRLTLDQIEALLAPAPVPVRG